MSAEPELELLRAAWRESGRQSAAGGIDERSHRRRVHILRLRRSSSLAFALALIVFAVTRARRDFEPETLIWALVVCATSAAAAAFEIRNWRGLWKDSGQSVADYLDAYEKHCRAALRAVAFGYRFLAFQLSITVPWLTFDFLRGQTSVRSYAIGLGVLALLTASFLFTFRRSRSKALRELSQVQTFRRKLTE